MNVRGVAGTALVTSAIVIAGCGGSGSSSGGSSGGPIPAYKSSEHVTISYWVPFTGGELNFVKQVVHGFEASHPGIKVNVSGNINDEKIIAATRSGNVPDAALSFTTNNTGVFCKDGTFLNLAAAIS